MQYKVMINRGYDYSQYYPPTTTSNSICIGTFQTKEAAIKFVEKNTKYNADMKNRMYILYDIIDWTRHTSCTSYHNIVERGR